MAHMSRACAAWSERLPSLAGGIFARLAPSSQQHLCGILASFKHESLVIIRECIYTIVGEKALGNLTFEPTSVRASRLIQRHFC